jgi:hypothetical protein
MILRTINKQSNTDRLTQEIIASGYPLFPNTGAKFYGCQCEILSDNTYRTTAYLVDDISQAESDAIYSIMDAHLPIPIPPTVTPLDEDHKPFVRAESRPLNCTTVFTTRGDNTVQIGEGDRLEWDASISDDWTEDGAPSGYKRKVVEVSFLDPVRLKEGCVYYMKAKKGSRLNMRIVCPNGGWYMCLGQPRQNLQGMDIEVEHYVCDLPIQGDVPMGDELNTETCSQELPTYMKIQLEVIIPTSDTDSYGYVLMEMYRCRTTVVQGSVDAGEDLAINEYHEVEIV